MSVIKINAIEVPEGQGPELEARFAARKHSVDNAPGFKGFQMLRPTKGEDRYFIVTEWKIFSSGALSVSLRTSLPDVSR